MSLKIKTTILQELISKSLKGAGNDALLVITSLMCIELHNNTLKLTTTDGQNFLVVSQNDVPGNDFYVVVGVDTFSKLVLRTTSEYIDLEIADGTLKVVGNGEYQIQLPLDDEEGSLLRYPQAVFDKTSSDIKTGTIPTACITSVLSANKHSLAKTLELPALTGFFMDTGCVITSDSFVVCANNISTFDTPVLLSLDLINLLSLVDEKDIRYWMNDNDLLFEAGSVQIFGYSMPEIDEYPLSAIRQFLDIKLANTCAVNRVSLISILDRLALFVDNYDENGVYLNFDRTGLIIKSKKNSASELLKYETQFAGNPFTACVDINKLTQQLNAGSENIINISYGDQAAIMLTCGKITQIISLIEDEAANG